MGRPNKYDTNVKPYLDDIGKMCLTMTEEQIAATLGVAYSSFRVYKKQYPALENSLKKGRFELVLELRSALIKRAKGFKYAETKETIENGIVTKIEKTVKTALPDVAALNLALKNYDKDNWSNDPQVLDLRKKELKLREQQIKANDW